MRIFIKKIFCFLLILTSASFLTAASFVKISDGYLEVVERNESRHREMKPAAEKNLSKEKETQIKIVSDVSNAEVYINGVYQGRTTLVLNSLRPGRYKIEIRKENYERERALIEVREGVSRTYEFKLHPIMGIIYFKNIPSDALVYIDDSRIYSFSSSEMIMGTHNLKIRRFNYEDIEEDFYLPAYGAVEVDPVFEKSDFYLWGFSVSKNTINPDYKNSAGKTKISFSVSAEGTAEIYICPEGSDEAVLYFEFPAFHTWDQSFEWNGTGSYDMELPDGIYDILLYCGDEVYQEKVTINRNLVYPLLTSTTAGFGAGHLPAIDPMNMKQHVLSVYGGPAFSNYRKESFYDNTTIALAFNSVPVNHFEYGLAMGVYPATLNQMMVYAGADLKLFDSVKISEKNYISYGGFFHIGVTIGSAEKPAGFKCLKSTAGIDNGNGIGGGVLLGYTLGKLSATASGQFTGFSNVDSVKGGLNLVEAGLVLSYKPVKVFSLNGYGSYNYGFGKDKSALNPEKEFYSIKGFSGGIEMNFMPGGSPVMLSLGAGTDFLSTGVNSVTGKAGISFIF